MTDIDYLNDNCGVECDKHPGQTCSIGFIPDAMKEGPSIFAMKDARDPHKHLHIAKHPDGHLIWHWYEELVDMYGWIENGSGPLDTLRDEEGERLMKEALDGRC